MRFRFSRVLLGIIVLAALVGPLLTGAPELPALAVTYAQDLPPGAFVQEARLEGGGFVRAPELRADVHAVRVTRGDSSRSFENAQLAEPPRARRLWLGSDHQGRDLLARTLAGARTSLGVALVSLVLSFAIGLALGLALALLPPALGAPIAMMRDAMLGLPRVLVLLALGLAFHESALGIALAIGLASWMLASRIVEERARSLVAGPLWMAALASGASRPLAAIRHLSAPLWSVLKPLVPVVATEAVLLEATLAFLGVGGAGESWGTIIADGRRLLGQSWWIALLPGLLLVLTAQALSSNRTSSPRPGA